MAVDEGSASEVYQTTLPSFLAAWISAASCAATSDVMASKDRSVLKLKMAFFIKASCSHDSTDRPVASEPANGPSHYYEISSSVNIATEESCSNPLTKFKICSIFGAASTNPALAR